MPFVKELPARTRKGSSKYSDILMKLVKNPNKLYQFDEAPENASGLAAQLRNSKFVKEVEDEENGSFEFRAISGELYAKFVKNTRSKK